MRLNFWNSSLSLIWATAASSFMLTDVQWPVTFALFYSLFALLVYPFGD